MLVTVGRFLDPWEAHILRARLIADGIPAVVAGDAHSTANWPIAFALGGTLLQVPDSYAQEATRVLKAYQSGELQQELVAGGYSAPDQCPSCGCAEPSCSVPGPQRLLAVVMFIFGATFPTSLEKRRCKGCGQPWQTEG
jgi:hypothetical protein